MKKQQAILCGKACEEFENEGFQLTSFK